MEVALFALGGDPCSASTVPASAFDVRPSLIMDLR